MPIAAIIGAVVGLGSSIGGSVLAGDAQKSAAKTASQTQLDMFHEIEKNLAPFLSSGQMSLQTLAQQLGINPGGAGFGNTALTSPLTAQQFQASPGYAFQKQQGMDAITNSAAARGGVFSGNTLEALDTFGTGLANQDWWNAYNANRGQQQQNFNMLSWLSNLGLNAGTNTGQFGQNTANNVASNQIGAGNVSGAQFASRTNALSNFFTNPQNQSNIASLLFGGGGGGGVPSDIASNPTFLASIYGG